MANKFFKKWIRRVGIIMRLIFKIDVRILKQGKGKDRDKYNTYQKRYINFNIKEREKVLDIGSGKNAFPLATHLADRYEGETTHRAGELTRDGRPFVSCDIEKMPFGDNAFDFIYCSHVLEHTNDPAAACDELMRVGKRGYIETPTKTHDIIFNMEKGGHHHRWAISMLQNTLIFTEWIDSEKRDTGCDYFAEQFNSLFKNPVQDFFDSNRDFVFNMLLWNSGFNYYVFDKRGNLINFKKAI